MVMFTTGLVSFVSPSATRRAASQFYGRCLLARAGRGPSSAGTISVAAIHARMKFFIPCHPIPRWAAHAARSFMPTVHYRFVGKCISGRPERLAHSCQTFAISGQCEPHQWAGSRTAKRAVDADEVAALLA